MKRFILGLMCIGLTSPALAQIVKTEELSEVTVYATNYKYLNSVASDEPAAVPVEMLERKVAAFDLENSEYYVDEYDYYQIRFYIPEGKILAAYDKDGRIIRTIERFSDIALPNSVKAAVLDRFPGWEITKDLYRVNYHEDKGAVKTYKLTLENGDKKIRVKVDDKGNFL
ncbi:nicotinate-nucleotide adenylyltransferase [Robiginitalea sediminis]|uniref:nicotinate-nucleotide adenylyltransferase n=1 Tax=Robiginitalea sediminis TaxID=1982593 RepID=UPI000B4B6A8B|nr:nicotinate-nucleotide adenylyltransferase [Robiginitalea sediminis]